MSNQYTPLDKLKIAKVVSKIIGVDGDMGTNPTIIVNNALRTIKGKVFNQNYINSIKNILSTLDEVGIPYDDYLVSDNVKRELSKDKLKEEFNVKLQDIGDGNFDLNESEIEELMHQLTNSDLYGLYSSSELSLIDPQTGVPIHGMQEMYDSSLSPEENYNTAIKYDEIENKRKPMLALKIRSNTKQINNRARELAIKTLEKAIAGKQLSELTQDEKQRLNTVIARNDDKINHVAIKLIPRIRHFELSTLSHGTFTKSNNY